MKNDTDSIALLRTKRYGAYWISCLLSSIGTWMQSVAEPWLVLSISGSSFLLGLDAFAMDAPFWLLTLVGGILADRKNRGLIIFFFQGIQMLCPLYVVVLIATGWIKVWMIIMLSLIVGITDALSMPAFSALIPSIVGKKEIRQALALNSIQFNLSRVLGPAIAGLVMMKYGPLWCFGANAISYIPFFLAIYWLLPASKRRSSETFAKQQALPAARSIKTIIKSPKTGWALLSVLMTALFCGPVITFSPVIVQQVLHADVGAFGGVLTAFGLGGLLGPILILMTMKRISPMKMSMLAALAYGLAIITVSSVATTWQLGLLLVGSGFFLTVANTSANAFLQSQANDDNRGQTASPFMLAMRGGLSVGNLVAGSMTNFVGVQQALMMNGVLAIMAQGYIFWRLSRTSSANIGKTA